MGKYLVFDLETGTKTKHKRKASCFVEENWIVARGWKKQGAAQCSWSYHPTHDRTTYLTIDPDVDLLVGFNLKFDLLWEMAQGNPELHNFYKRGGRIWDCQYAEYLLFGQTPDVQMCSLDSRIESYGGKKKIDEVKLLWEAGVDTPDIQEDLLIDYLVGTEEEGRDGGDIRNTEIMFLGQIRKAVEQNQVKMIQDRMDGLLATTEMEFRGLKVDMVEARRALAERTKELEAVEKELEGHLPELPFQFNWGSRTHVSCLLFGGTVKYVRKANYTDEKTGELARYKATADWPLFGGEARSLDSVLFDNEREMYFDIVGNWKPSLEPGNPNIVPEVNKRYQDTFVSGAKKGQPKFRKVEVQGELKERLTDFFHRAGG
jgi:DNA polymerase-1